ncbi:FAD-dependent monooxygenase [Pseudonocardia sp. TRM90224]|uniref:FAD-dependent monooxygenase n=1 Tax=Pseudonocardia sp. TRM90224 TaxID=2812678 RepID=UPI001E3D4301|nr:FAD-dependent monooxygenase [Pseudonocardia sp. TRM90224]
MTVDHQPAARIACVGGGPGGLLLAILAIQLPDVESVTVYERSPEGVTYGWGVVFWDDLLDQLREHDAPTAELMKAAAFTWHHQVIDVEGGDPVDLGGHGYAMGRRAMRGLLTERARALGVEMRFDQAVGDVAELDGYDLVVAADGVSSGIRQAEPAFGTSIERGRNKYIWLGTSKVFPSFTFPFARTGAGWLWAHAYGYSDDASTFVVETTPETWAALGFDTLGPDETARELERIFAAQLDGHELRMPTGVREGTPWLEFQTVRNVHWQHGNVALLGDAAHTTHFTIGSGTRLALQDAMALAAELGTHRAAAPALAAYEHRRTAELAPVAAEAAASALWFEDINRYINREPRAFAQLLINRRRLLARRAPAAYIGLRKLRKAAAAAPIPAPARAAIRKVKALAR